MDELFSELQARKYPALGRRGFPISHRFQEGSEKLDV